MNDRDCESCKKFSRNDPHESEGYCDAKRTWVDPQEGEDCKMHEFTLHSATKYKDGTPIMSEPEKIYCETDSALIHGESNQLDTEYCDHILDRIYNLERMYVSILDDLCAMHERLCKITDLLVGQNKHAHIFSNFCGNCINAEMKDGICTCELSGEIIDPDSASCSLFVPSYTSNPIWFENMKKTMTTPSEPTAGCKDCNHAKDGMCTKYNCSLGAICATPECFEPPF